MPKRRTVSPDQRNLIPSEGPFDEGWWSCNGVFTRPYLRQQLANNEICPAVSEVETVYEVLKKRWLDNLAGLQRQGEAYTRTRFLDPTLSDLGWYFIPEASLPEGPTRKKPDYCIFSSEGTEQEVAAGSATDIFRASSSVVEAKKVEHPLDEVSKRETPGWFPSQQIQNYLQWATDNTGQRFFRWAILTNGNEWRLYSWDAAPNSYFSFHLTHGDEFCPIDEFRLFIGLFRPGSFDRNEQGRCLLDDIREQSLTQQVQLEGNLKRRIFDVLEDLAEGFYNHSENHLGEDNLNDVYENSLIFLYRLLFILYAESRGLLPAKTRGVGANKRYRDEFSLARFVEKLRDRNSFPDDAFDGLYEDLLKLFHLINGTKKARNTTLGVTRYNGGLFNPSLHPKIESWRIGEKSLGNVLRQLIFAQAPARQRTPQRVISTNETIDYGTLEVRQLGDIYEGLLGGQLRPDEENRLNLINEDGTNHREGIFYTPDWVVRYLIQETVGRLLEQIDQSEQVQRAIKADSDERKKDNSFAFAVLKLNIVDPAMGSGHFLVRAVEYLGDQIVNHSTTRRMTEKIVPTGAARRTKDEILSSGRIPVPQGVSQEQAEIAYWRRRVVESCIYGVDKNPLAVELTKLSLWLTCIAVDEPLNFLDHHLHCGNSLLWAKTKDLPRLEGSTDEEAKQSPFSIGDQLTSTLSEAIRETTGIESQASTEMEIVKRKEDRWREVQRTLRPYLHIANLWLAALDDFPINQLDYSNLALLAVRPGELSNGQKRDARKLSESLRAILDKKIADLQPFHWELEYPEVFYHENGESLPQEARGFDAILGNPPYISTHTSSAESWRDAVEKRFGYLEDLYVHFTDLGFHLLRPGGVFGFIVSDTFFTLTGKLGLRQLLQSNKLVVLGQCDPFEATVDAAIFAAQKGNAEDQDRLLFVQARNGTTNSQPEKELPQLPRSEELKFKDEPDSLSVLHGFQGCVRFHNVPISVYRNAARRAFFEPRPQSLKLYEKYNSALKMLADEWWEKIKDSRRFQEHLDEIRTYHASLRPGDITLIGLIAEGAQGMRTGNNAKFIGYLEATPQAREILRKRELWSREWFRNRRIKGEFVQAVTDAGGNPKYPTINGPAWEAAVGVLRNKFSARELGFSRNDLYRLVSPEQVGTQEDFEHTWRKRKEELLTHWRDEPELADFWSDTLLGPEEASKYRQGSVSDEQFCELCEALIRWWERENEKRRRTRPRRSGISRSVLGLKSSEHYSDPKDAPRIATIYNGLSGKGLWVPFRKSDPEGSRWLDNDPLYIDWSDSSVEWLSHASEARWQGHSYFLTHGVAWTALANHTSMKARFQEPCIFDASSMRLTPLPDVFDPLAFLALLNSNVVSYFKMKFIRHTQTWEIGDLRTIPIVIPSKGQSYRLRELTETAMTAKRLSFGRQAPDQEFIAHVRTLNDELQSKAPSYLHAPAQLQLLRAADDCLGIIERAVNWEAEKLYGVEGEGPFDEF